MSRWLLWPPGASGSSSWWASCSWSTRCSSVALVASFGVGGGLLRCSMTHAASPHGARPKPDPGAATAFASCTKFATTARQWTLFRRCGPRYRPRPGQTGDIRTAGKRGRHLAASRRRPRIRRSHDRRRTSNAQDIDARRRTSRSSRTSLATAQDGAWHWLGHFSVPSG